MPIYVVDLFFFFFFFFSFLFSLPFFLFFFTLFLSFFLLFSLFLLTFSFWLFTFFVVSTFLSISNPTLCMYVRLIVIITTIYFQCFFIRYIYIVSICQYIYRLILLFGGFVKKKGFSAINSSVNTTSIFTSISILFVSGNVTSKYESEYGSYLSCVSKLIFVTYIFFNFSIHLLPDFVSGNA